MTLPALIASDVDGTLLDDDEKITARTRGAVRAAVDAGAQFVLATGRPPRWVQPVVDALGFAPMAVCANGAVIYDPATDRIVVGAHAVGRRNWASSPRSPPAPSPARAWRSSGWAAARTTRPPRSSSAHRATSTPGSTPTTPRCRVEDLLGAPAIKLLIRKAGARSSDMAAELAKHVGLQGDITYSTNNGLIEIVPLGISKATGVEEVARPLGITAEDVVAFGDMPNDMPMLRWAGLGVAMGNAHPEAVAAADEVTAPNTDDGLARVLERWWL